MRTSRVTDACRILTLAVLTGCLVTVALAADRISPERERRRVESVRKLCLQARTNGTAKQRLKFGSTYLSDPALDEIVKGFPNLEFLHAICHANVTDIGVARVCELKKIKMLRLRGKGITNNGLKSLSKIKGLETLLLMDATIDDAGLQQLKTLKKLKSLRLSRTKVTVAGVQQLQKHLPKCKITRSPQLAAAKTVAR